jgi:hypothetical protein
VNRTEAVDWWRAGYEAGVRCANRQSGAEFDRAASYLAACRAGEEQSRFDALLLELVAALASMFCPVCGEDLPPDSGRCDACTARSRRDGHAPAWPVTETGRAA